MHHIARTKKLNKPSRVRLESENISDEVEDIFTGYMYANSDSESFDEFIERVNFPEEYN